MKFFKHGVRYWLDEFEDLKSFDVIPYQHVVDLYLKTQAKLSNQNYEKLGGWNDRPINSDVEELDAEKFWQGYDPVYYNIDPHGKKVTQAKADVVSMDMAGVGQTWDSFIYLILPAELFKQYQMSVHSNPDIRIFRKFIKAVEDTEEKWEYKNYTKIMAEFDEKYPEKTLLKNFFKAYEDFAWRLDCEVGQFITMRDNGIIYPICYNSKKFIFKRGTHRVFFLSETNSDVPIFLQYPKNDDIDVNNWNVIMNGNFIDGHEIIMNINVADNKLSFYFRDECIGEF